MQVDYMESYTLHFEMVKDAGVPSITAAVSIPRPRPRPPPLQLLRLKPGMPQSWLE